MSDEEQVSVSEAIREMTENLSFMRLSWFEYQDEILIGVMSSILAVMLWTLVRAITRAVRDGVVNLLVSRRRLRVIRNANYIRLRIKNSSVFEYSIAIERDEMANLVIKAIIAVTLFVVWTITELWNILVKINTLSLSMLLMTSLGGDYINEYAGKLSDIDQDSPKMTTMALMMFAIYMVVYTLSWISYRTRHSRNMAVTTLLLRRRMKRAYRGEGANTSE